MSGTDNGSKTEEERFRFHESIYYGLVVRDTLQGVRWLCNDLKLSSGKDRPPELFFREGDAKACVKRLIKEYNLRFELIVVPVRLEALLPKPDTKFKATNRRERTKW